MSDYEFDPGAYEQDFGDSEESAGFVNEPLPRGRYPFRVDKIVNKSTTQKGVPQVGVLLRVNEGGMENRTALVNLYLDASPSFRKDGEDFVRTPEQISKARKGVAGRMKGILSAMDLPHDNPVAASADDPVAFLCEKFGIDNMPGQTFMAEVTVQGKYNNLLNFHNNSHEKYGLEAWRELQENASTSGGAGSSL